MDFVRGFAERFVQYFYFKGNLNDSRISIDSLEKAKAIFSQRFPGKEPIVITDNRELVNRGAKYYLEIAPNETDCAVIAFESDQKAYEFIQANKNIIYIPAQKFYPTARYFHKSDLAKDILLAQSLMQEEKFEVADYENIIQVLENVRNIDGDYVEIGVYKGGSAYTALKYMKARKIEKKVYLLDTFEGFKYNEAALSVDRFWSNRLDHIDIGSVRDFLCDFDNCEIVKSNIIRDPLPSQIHKVAACNIDVDMYEAISASLNKICGLIVVGGIIILEDVGHTPSLIGAHIAYQEFMNSDYGKSFHSILLSSGQALLIKYR